MPEGRAYVVLGGAGYIGSATVRALLRRDEPVVSLDIADSAPFPWHPLGERGEDRSAACARVDLTDPDAVRRTFARIAARWRDLVVVHLAGLFVKDAARRRLVTEDEYRRHNVVATVNVVRALNELDGVARVVYQSAGGAYRTFLDGGDRPLEPYVQTKLDAERALTDDLRAPWVVLRPVRVLGLDGPWRPPARRRRDGLLGALRHARDAGAIPTDIVSDLIVGGIRGARCAIALEPANSQIAYVHLHDCVAALVAATSPLTQTHQVYNVTTWPAITFHEMGAILHRELGALGIPVEVTCRDAAAAIVLTPARSPHFAWRPRLGSSREVVTVALWQYLERVQAAPPAAVVA